MEIFNGVTKRSSIQRKKTAGDIPLQRFLSIDPSRFHMQSMLPIQSDQASYYPFSSASEIARLARFVSTTSSMGGL